MRWLIRRLTHRVVFHHRFVRSVLLIELEGLPFAAIACERCGYYDPELPLGVYVHQDAQVFRVIDIRVREGAAVQ